MRFLLGAVGMIAIIGWYLPTLVWGAKISSAMGREANGEQVDYSDLMKGPAPLAWWNNRKELAETFSPDDLNGRRYVLLSVNMPFEDLLNPGEDAPKEAFRDLYAEARAPAHIQRFCAELLGHLATRCDVTNTGGSVRDGIATMSGWLMYAPAYDMGDPSAVSNGEMFTGHGTLAGRDELTVSDESRAIILSRALAVCDGLREVYGNCIVGSLNVQANSRSDSYAVSASFDVYADISTTTRDSFKAEVDRIVALQLAPTQ